MCQDERNQSTSKEGTDDYIYMCNCDSPWSAKPGFKEGCGEVSFGLILLPVGGKHLLEKKAAIFFALRTPFSGNWKKKTQISFREIKPWDDIKTIQISAQVSTWRQAKLVQNFFLDLHHKIINQSYDHQFITNSFIWKLTSSILDIAGFLVMGFLEGKKTEGSALLRDWVLTHQGDTMHIFTRFACDFILLGTCLVSLLTMDQFMQVANSHQCPMSHNKVVRIDQNK